ncbi:MAG: DUF559 domain-containing protein [Cyanobacteria bacterium J06554_6]
MTQSTAASQMPERAAVQAFIYSAQQTVSGIECVDPLPALVSYGWEKLGGQLARCDRILTHTFTHLPDQSQIVAATTAQLATVAQKLWPAWYGQTDLFHDALDATDALLNRYACLDVRSVRGGVNLPWLKAAVRACGRGQLPVLPAFPSGLQLGQLAMAIEPGSLGIAIALTDPAPANHCLFALAKTLPWLADQTQTPVALLIPEPLADSPALAPVLYGAVTLPPANPLAPAAEESKHTVYPVQGRPHPFSPGEQRLAQRLAQDDELAVLFGFNQSVQTVRHRYLVDLLWPAGRVVVEIDGYGYHADRFSFSQDRQRDYELLISGYIVLRLPHNEVMDDVEMALDKIRDVVRFRRLSISEGGRS